MSLAVCFLFWKIDLIFSPVCYNISCVSVTKLSPKPAYRLRYVGKKGKSFVNTRHFRETRKKFSATRNEKI